MSKLNVWANLTKSFPSMFSLRVCNHSDSSTTNKSQRVKQCQRTNETRCLWKTCGAKNYALLGSCATPCDTTVDASQHLQSICVVQGVLLGWAKAFFFFLLLQHSLVNDLLEKLSGGFFALGGWGEGRRKCQSLEYCWSIHCNVTK